VWALRMGTRLETRPRYTPTTCFETFPFPTGVIPELRTLPPHLTAISAAAYGWPSDLTDEAILERLLSLNQERA
jgi:hypothetical protein